MLKSGKFLLILAAISIMAIGMAINANATPVLTITLTSGASTVTVTDGGVGDSNPAAGEVTFIGAVGNFSTNVSTGLVQGSSSSYAAMDLSSVNTSSAAGTLTILLTETFRGADPGILTGGVGGTTHSGTSLEFEAYKEEDPGGQYAAYIDIIPTMYPTGSLIIPFAGNASDTHGAIGAYTMGLLATITHDGTQTTSFNFNVINAVPEPASLLLLGTGLIGIGVLARRRMK